MSQTTNYLTFCTTMAELDVFTPIEAFDVNSSKKFTIEKGSKIKLVSFNHDKNGIEIVFNYPNQRFILPQSCLKARLDWDTELPFTHFKTAEEAYKHAKFTKISFGTNLENWIFGRSPKFATKYSVEVSNKRLSEFLEKKIFRNCRYLLYYSIKFDINLSEKQEEVFLNDKIGRCVALYGLKKIKGKLPETLHNYLIMIAASGSTEYFVGNYFESLKDPDNVHKYYNFDLNLDYY